MFSNTSTAYKIFITILLFSIDTIYSYLSKHVPTTFKNFCKKPHVSILIKNKICTSNDDTIRTVSYDFIGTMLYIHDNVDKGIFDISNLELSIDNHARYWVDMIYLNKDSNKPFKINDDVSLVVRKFSTTSDSKKGSYEFDVYEMEIISTKNDIKQIKDFQTSMIDYCETKRGYKKSGLYIKRIEEFDPRSCTVPMKQVPFTSTKTFDNMFFEGKANLISYLNKFMNGKDTYIKLGIPYTLGFMLYGEPGCGKTSIIKSIARYMNRNIIIIDTTKVTTRDKLELLFTKYKDDSIFVFEEIDCGPWKNIIMDRNLKKANNAACQESSENHLTMDLMKMVVDKIDSNSNLEKKKDHSNEKIELTLSDLLEVLDGIVDMDERVIICTTNHKEVIDPALLRPGRIDHVIEFTKMSKRCIRDMYKQWFDEDIPDYVYEDMHDNIFTQAEVGKIFKTLDKPKRLNALRMGKY